MTYDRERALDEDDRPIDPWDRDGPVHTVWAKFEMETQTEQDAKNIVAQWTTGMPRLVSLRFQPPPQEDHP